MSFNFGDKTWPELKEAIEEKSVVIVPVGTTEEHGKHLPVETDSLIAEMYGQAFGKALHGKIPALVTRPIYFGYSMNVVENWPGTLKIRTRVFMDYMFDIIGSLIKMGFKKVVLLDCHGNHDGLLRTVMREIADETGEFICTLAPGKLCESEYNKIKKDPEGDIHGGEWETSMILAFKPELVNADQYTNVDAIKCNGTLRGPVSTWGLQETKTGLFGDPTYASAELGRACLDAGVKEGVKIIEEYYKL